MVTALDDVQTAVRWRLGLSKFHRRNGRHRSREATGRLNTTFVNEAPRPEVSGIRYCLERSPALVPGCTGGRGSALASRRCNPEVRAARKTCSGTSHFTTDQCNTRFSTRQAGPARFGHTADGVRVLRPGIRSRRCYRTSIPRSISVVCLLSVFRIRLPCGSSHEGL